MCRSAAEGKGDAHAEVEVPRPEVLPAVTREELTPEAFEQQRVMLLGDLERRRSRSDRRRMALRQHAGVVVDQALGTVLGGAILFLGGVAGGVLKGVDGLTIGAASATVSGFVLGLIIAARNMPAPEEIALYRLEREAAWDAWQRQRAEGGGTEAS